jgi:2Fe-2S ferredoxin
MSVITVTLVEGEGVERRLENLAPGQSLMVAACDAGVAGIRGDCGGGCACATCHVYIAPEWIDRVGPPDAVEDVMLDVASLDRRPESRLCCQIVLNPALDGLTVTVASPARL